MERARLILKPREDLRIRSGHPWVYDNEIDKVEGEAGPAAEVEVLDARRRSLGCAFYNPSSKIRARIYSRIPRPADEDFFSERILRALDWRKRFFDPSAQSLRLVFGEADGIPGLIVDSFVGTDEANGKPGRWLAAQFLSLGVEARKAAVLSALKKAWPADGVAERSDAPVRLLEGLEPRSGALAGDVPRRAVMVENGLRFAVDILGGQKTGWFLDQRSNRAAAAAFAKDARIGGRRVLDAFCNAGGFGLCCASSGATEVVAVDSSGEAIAAAAGNADRNGLTGVVRFVEANAFDYLRALERARERFGLVILDPPAFAKNRASTASAHRGYKDLNLRALRLVEDGGILVSCSCSYWFGRERFASMLEEAAADTGKRVRIIAERGQDLDHPIVAGYGESRYLTCVIAEISSI